MSENTKRGRHGHQLDPEQRCCGWCGLPEADFTSNICCAERQMEADRVALQSLASERETSGAMVVDLFSALKRSLDSAERNEK